MMAGALLDSIINETLAGRNEFMLQEVATAGATSSPSADLLASLDPNYSSGGDLLQNSNNNNIEMGQWERLFWVLIFSVMVIVAAGGNTIVVYIVATNKEMKSVTNYFLVNLSLADTMVSTLNVIFNFISMLNSHWPFGKIYCKISNFIAILSISASVFTLTAISCDRYNAILHPLRPRMSHRHAIGWILLIWTLSSALAMPNAIFSTDVEDRLTNDNVAVTCTMLWPDGRYPLSSYDHIYNIIILVVTYLVPIVTMAILYYKVGKELWGYEAIGENIDKQQRAILAKKKDVPLHYQRCYFVMYWLAMSNSMYNPIIIYFMNSKFRLEFKKILCYFICCCRAYKPSHRSSTQTAGNQPQRAATATIATNNRRQTTFECNQEQHGVTSNQAVLRNDAKDNHKSCPKVGSNELDPRSDISIEDGGGGGRKKPLSDDYDENEPFISAGAAAAAATVASANDNRRAANRLLDNAGGHESKPADANGVKIIPNDRLIDFSTTTTTTTTSNSIDRFTNEGSEKVWI